MITRERIATLKKIKLSQDALQWADDQVLMNALRSDYEHRDEIYSRSIASFDLEQAVAIEVGTNGKSDNGLSRALEKFRRDVG